MKKALLLLILAYFMSQNVVFAVSNRIQVGADRLEEYLPLLENKKVALVVNQTSVLSDKTHLLDTLLSKGVQVLKVFAPEHGFRGDLDAGESVLNGKDRKTGLQLISLYGKNKKPTAQMLNDVDVVVFDIQDVGARFYTYISTMYYVMDACAEHGKEMLVLDRPNPHDFVDGPVLDMKYRSFVGMLPIPVLHGVTIAELAMMINGEGWLTNSRKVNLRVVPVTGWEHGATYSLPVKPSPNLPNDQAVKLYASLCFFEATDISIGRGTYFPFQVIGYPDPRFGQFSFTPISLPGYDKNPLQKDRVCYGMDLREIKFEEGFTLQYLIAFYKIAAKGAKFFTSPQFMNLLSGTNKLQDQIISGISEQQIRNTWRDDLTSYKLIRNKYLLYTDKEY